MCRTARPSPPATTAGPAATLAQRSNHLTLLEGPAHSLWAKAATSFGDNLRALAASAKNGRIATRSRYEDFIGDLKNAVNKVAHERTWPRRPNLRSRDKGCISQSAKIHPQEGWQTLPPELKTWRRR